MRASLLCMAAVPMLFVTHSGATEIWYPWCSKEPVNGSFECSFRSEEQCTATAKGLRGGCLRNPARRPTSAPAAPASKPHREASKQDREASKPLREASKPHREASKPHREASGSRRVGTVSITLASAGIGQSRPSVVTGNKKQIAASIPDFSGIWAHPYLPGFEPPASGPGPVTNRARLPNGVSNWNKLVGDYTNPILRPNAAEIVRKYGEISLAGVTYPTPTNQCWPQPVPFILWDIGLQLLQQPDKVTIVYSNPLAEFRQVRLNRQHPKHVTPSWYGDSIGHYEGDTLVVDTVGVKTDRPFAMVDVYGTPYTEAMHVVERYRLIDYEETKEGIARAEKENLHIPVNDSGLSVDYNYRGKALLLEFTVEDRGVFTRPWSATMTYRHALNEQWPESVCSENISEYYYKKNSEVPAADKPDF
jgi:hypothetical protein